MENYRQWRMTHNGELLTMENDTMANLTTENYRQWKMTDNGEL